MKINFKRGFTLIELLVVIAIIGLLSSVVLASLSSAREKSRDAKRLSDLHEIDNAIQLYINTNGHAPYLVGLTAADCSASNPANVRSMDLTAGNCEALSTDATSWGVLATELQPYMSKLSVDPVNISERHGGTANLYYAYAAPANLSQNCDPLIDDNGPARCSPTFGNNSAYGLYAGKEAMGGFQGDISTQLLFSASSPRSFAASIGSR